MLMSLKLFSPVHITTTLVRLNVKLFYNLHKFQHLNHVTE